MLGSITPLGERGRGSSWWVTVTAYVTGSALGGVALGVSLGWLGASRVDATVGARLVVLGIIVAIGLALDLGVFGGRLPTVHRQVDEAWRTRYRGWVWGLGYGAELGVGVVTIVTTSMVYAAWAAALLSGGALAGAAVGAAFGLSRALPVFSVAGVRRPDQVLRIDAGLARLAAPARRATYATGVVLASASIVGGVRW
jgi:Cytochrome C biogenesis protein transmembrane region